MKAVTMIACGEPEDVLRFQEIPEPSPPPPHSLRIRLHAAGINPVDAKLRRRGLLFPNVSLPAVLGCDGAGVVESIGAGVTRFQPGDEVWYCHGGLGREPGNYAEWNHVPETVAQPKPKTLSWAEAAASPLVLLTAWEALFDRARLLAGQTVLIHAGAGGVGHLAIQMAKLAGARIATTVGSQEKAEWARRWGAEKVILYREQNFVEAILDWTGGRGVDVAFDTVGPEIFRQSIPAVAPYGDLVTLLAPDPGMDWQEARVRNLRIGFELMLTPMLRDLPEARDHQGEILRRCGEWFDQHKLTLLVSHTFPLAEAIRAHHLIEAGRTLGKMVLTMDV
ncbi:NADPH:quinone reductase [Gammaproteobacteria bacterium]